MRRTDREITNVNDIKNIIDKCDVIRIAINDEIYPYIIPVNFGYEFIDDKLTLFFHSSTEGYKHKVIENDNHISFEMDCSHILMQPVDGIACSASMAYESVIGQGIVSAVGDDEKETALIKILEHYNIDDKKFNSMQLAKTKVYKIQVHCFNAKRRTKDR